MIENFELVKRGSKTYKLNTEFNYVAPVKFIHGKKTSEFYEQFCPEDNIVTPNLGVDLMAQDIDLAIFELECYLFEKHGDINIAYAKWNQEQKELKQLHHQELQKLL